MKILILFSFFTLLGACAESGSATDLIIIDQLEGSNFYINYTNGETGVFSSGNAAVKIRLEKSSNSCRYSVFSARVMSDNSGNDIYDISISEVISTRGLNSYEISKAEEAINGLPYKSGKICFPLNN